MARFFRFLSVVNSTSTPAEPPEAVTAESDFVVILAALLCAIICAVGLIAVARCAWLRRGTAAFNSQLQAQSLANKGLKKKTLQSLPKLTYDVDSKSKFESECAICLVEYVDGDEIRVLPQCSHGFHVGCIDTWLGSHSSCPSCRQILVVPRCRKCGEYPAISGDTTETEVKSRVEVGGSSEFLP